MDDARGWLYEKLMLAAGLVESDPRTYLFEKKPDWDEGFDCDAVNERARQAGAIGPDEFIIEPGEDPSQDPGTPRPTRWIRFHHPDRHKPPIRIVVMDSSGWSGKVTKGHADRIAVYLRAWAERCQAPRGGKSQDAPVDISATAASLVRDFGGLIDTAWRLRAEVHRLEEAEAAGELTHEVRRGWFPDPGQEGWAEENGRLRSEPHRDPAIKAMRINRSMRKAADDVLSNVSSVSAWMDDLQKPAHERWTAVVDADVRELLGCLLRGQPRDISQSDLPWPDQGISEAMGVIVERLERQRHELIAAKRTQAKPVVVPRELIGKTGDLHPDDAAALLTLAESEVWGVDEIPEFITAEVLLCLDRAGFVQARHVVTQNQQRFRGDLIPPTPSPGQWYSPLRQEGIGGPWESVLLSRQRDSHHHPFEIRVSQLGKAEVVELGREAGDEEPDEVQGWTQEKVIKAVKHHLQRNPFPGVRPLQRIIRCPLGTLAAALDADPELNQKRDDYVDGRQAKHPSIRAGNAGDAIKDAGGESPAPELMEEKADWILHRLVDEYEPADREAAKQIVRERRGDLRDLLINAMEADDPDAYKAASDAVHDLIRQGVRERSRS